MDRNKHIFSRKTIRCMDTSCFGFSLSNYTMFCCQKQERKREARAVDHKIESFFLGWRHSFFTFHNIVTWERENNVKSINNLGRFEGTHKIHKFYVCSEKGATLLVWMREKQKKKKFSAKQWYREKPKEETHTERKRGSGMEQEKKYFRYFHFDILL